MSEITKVALDAMGGDNAPGEMVKGAVDAIQKRKDIKVFLVGKEEMIQEELKKYNIDIMFICINGKLGNMNVNDAVKLTKIINPTVGIPTHYGMFESNTENPEKYISKLDCGFEMEYNRTYDIVDVFSK